MKSKLYTCVILFSCLFILTRPATSTESSTGFKVKTIYLDPWYGGKENGPRFAQKRYGKDIALELAQKLQGQLDADGFKVYLSRLDDQFVTPENRLLQGRARGADIHISIRVSRTKKDGIRIFVASLPINETPQMNETKKIEELEAQIDTIVKHLESEDIMEESLLLGAKISKNLKNSLTLGSVELRKDKEYILTNAQLPTVLVDIGSSSGPNQKTYLINEASINKITRSLADSIKEYFAERAPKANQ
jgi:N-acetylmuramoyl-L-alanine amidase